MQATGTVALAKIQHDAAEVRCRCRVCGAHAFARPAIPMAGICGNCGSLELESLDARPRSRRRISGGEAPATPPAALEGTV